MFVERLLPKARERLATIADGAHLVEAARLLRAGTDPRNRVRSGRPDGRGRHADIVSQLSVCDEASCVADIPLAVTRDIFSCRPEDRLQDVWLKIAETRFKNIPVTCQDGRPLRVMTAQDVFRILLEEAEYDQAMLRDYVMGVGFR